MANDNSEYTVARRLLEVNKAIEAVLLGGQAVKIGSRTVTRADLKQLRAMRDELEAQIAAATPSPLMPDTYVAFFDGR
ncbi:MAG: peptidylprolyl isomerase [Oscillibacter sp.]|nr:peptidylprolyl isomerase [Oscillibacter sp.]